MKINAFLSLLFLLATSCSSPSTGSAPPKGAVKIVPAPVPVMSARAVQKSVPVKLHAIGNVQAYSTVTVKAMVGGTLTHVNFKEGQFVSKGELLFRLDSRPFEVQLRQMEANLARDKAQAENARQQAVRYKELVANGYVAKEQYDQIFANAQAEEATLLADESAVENAKLQLEYCYIQSPIDGVTGNLLVHEGNLVKANDVSLVVINQVRPVFVSFSVPGQNLPEIKKFMSKAPLKVEALPTDKESRPVTGELVFVDNMVDLQTGTIQLKGVFQNGTKSLWPGQFVNVDLFLSHLDDAVVVPTQAVQTGQFGQYLFVVKPDQTVESRTVTVSRVMEEESVIEKGIAPGEEVVIDGQSRLVPGSKVTVKK
ncbi:MAG: efflux RND transporter periplasmic adaptor subunit [Nitrospirae bacterium]|nr:efflux RND transporter periplasmic adaptor subunit [Nitrospirota bacterium]MBI3593632.1 efflux RND transporter periplasmic adaptor subunit [Nitrospirota bacterium]